MAENSSQMHTTSMRMSDSGRHTLVTGTSMWLFGVRGHHDGTRTVGRPVTQEVAVGNVGGNSVTTPAQ